MVKALASPLVMFQPVVGFDGLPYKVEALSPPPPDATRDQIAHHDDAVMDTACRQVAAWQLRCPNLQVGVNLPPHRLLDPRLPAVVKAALRSSRLHPPLLHLELLEEPIDFDHPLVRANLARLCALGVHIALDDLGAGAVAELDQAERAITGPGTFAWRTMLQTVKLDRSLVAGSDVQRLGDFLRLATSHRLSVIAEGVETQEQLDQLVELADGCHLFCQGWLFGKKASADQFATIWLPPLPSLN